MPSGWYLRCRPKYFRLHSSDKISYQHILLRLFAFDGAHCPGFQRSPFDLRLHGHLLGWGDPLDRKPVRSCDGT